MPQIQLHAAAALNAMADGRLKPADIDGVATVGERPVTVAPISAWPDPEMGRRHRGRRLLVHDPCRRPDDLRRALFAARGKLCASVDGHQDLGFVPRGEAGRFIAERNTAPGVPGTAHRPTYQVRGLKAHGRQGIPLNTNGGGLSYMHSGMYGMYALQESVCQMRGTAPQIPDAKISVRHGVVGMFAASGTIIMSNEAPQSS